MARPDPETGEILEPSNARLDEHGWELLDGTPVSLPSGMKRPDTLQEQIRRMIRTAVDAGNNDVDNWEEANDFDVADDFDPSSPFETQYDPVIGREISPDEFRSNPEAYKALYQAATRDYHRARYLAQLEERAYTPQKPGAGQRPASAPPEAPPKGAEGA